jgi:hypothetical protein
MGDDRGGEPEQVAAPLDEVFAVVERQVQLALAQLGDAAGAGLPCLDGGPLFGFVEVGVV